MGVILILGSGNKVHIPLAATGIFVALIIILPLIYEKLLSPGQRAALGHKLRALKPGGGHGALDYSHASFDDRSERDQLRAPGAHRRD